MKYIKFKTKISRMGQKLIMNVPKSIEHLFQKGDKVLFCKEEDYNEEQQKFRNKNNEQ